MVDRHDPAGMRPEVAFPPRLRGGWTRAQRAAGWG
jgi:hypothetical protein